MNANGELYFVADDGTHGYELWRSDGTAPGTNLIKDINPGEFHSHPNDILFANGRIYFTASSDVRTEDLYGMGPVIFGTTGIDEISIQISNQIKVTVNGQSYYRPLGTLLIAAQGGKDKVSVLGTNGDEMLVASPRSFEFSGDGFQILGQDIEDLVVRGGGGNDVAILNDSLGVERVVAKVGNVFVRNLDNQFTHRAIDFGEVHLKSAGTPSENFDLANLFDSPVQDEFVGGAETAQISSRLFLVTTEGYDRNIARSVNGGYDVAILNGTENGNENFTAPVTANPQNNFGIMRSGTGADQPFLNRAIGFSRVEANSNGGSDNAYLFDGKGIDRLTADSKMARLEGSGYQFVSKNFARTNTRATQGEDYAILVDSSGNDRLIGEGDQAILRGPSGSFIQATFGFVRVTGNARNGGIDRLELDESLDFTFIEKGSWELR